MQQFVKTERAHDPLGQIEASTSLMKLAHLTNDVAGVREHENKAKIKCIVAMQNVRNDQVTDHSCKGVFTATELYLTELKQVAQLWLGWADRMPVFKGQTSSWLVQLTYSQLIEPT